MATPAARTVPLHFYVRADLVIGGRMQPPSTPAGVSASLRREQPVGTAQPIPDGAVTRFLLAGWVGGGNPDFSLSPLGPDGVAEVRLVLREGDPDTVKFSVSFNMVVPKGQRNCHLASYFLPAAELAALLRDSPRVFSPTQRCFSMRDNFTKNVAVLRFQNIDTDHGSLLSLPLRPSALLALDRTNAAVFGLGQRLKQAIASFTVSPMNAGPQYIEAFSYLQMQNALVHYSLIGYAFSRLTTPYQLPWIMYDAYQAAHTAGVHPAALGALDDVHFVHRFGQGVITAHTACGLTSVYCTDYTINAFDAVCKLKETEDMAKTFGCLSLQSQAGLESGVAATSRSYTPRGPPPSAPAPSLQQCVDALARAQRARREQGLSRRVSFAGVLDDCENAAQGIIMKAKGIQQVYEGVVAGGGGGGGDSAAVGRLADQMCRVAATDPWGRLFGNLSRQDHITMAACLMRLGALLSRGDWTTAFAVVSAKGPSYTEENPNAPGALSGHGTVVSRLRTAGTTYHGPLEGTTYLCQDPPVPPSMDEGFRVRLDDGSVAAFDNSVFATVFAQNVHRCVGISADNCILGHLQADYGSNPQRCPFYVSAFYTGLSEGDGLTLGCIPLDTNPPANFCSGAQPVFGAPVMGLSRPSTMAVTVPPSLLSDDPKEQDQLVALIDAQMQEACCPEASQDTIAAIASYWQPVAPLRTTAELMPPLVSGGGMPLLRRSGFGGLLRTINTWAFDDPAAAGMAVRLYGALAIRFNLLQARDPQCDGVVAAAFGHYLSAALRFDVPMRPRGSGVVALSTMRNLRQAAADVGIAALVDCPLKMAQVQARSAIGAEHHFYMCDRGEGPVHAHRARLA